MDLKNQGGQMQVNDRYPYFSYTWSSVTIRQIQPCMISMWELTQACPSTEASAPEILLTIVVGQ